MSATERQEPMCEAFAFDVILKLFTRISLANFSVSFLQVSAMGITSFLYEVRDTNQTTSSNHFRATLTHAIRELREPLWNLDIDP